ncbi:MAG: hypothetical protein NC308_09760 [Clostridium sp.]|nr:hypothetical protein [Bacteroides sp.]MCM1199161.1 hypothetical protein [Clostridium sp.]
MKSKIPATLTLSTALLCSCSIGNVKIPDETPEDIVMNIRLDTGSIPSPRSAEAYTVPMEYETMVHDVQIFIYDTHGKLESYYAAEGDAARDIYVNTSSGEKTVWAVVNGPDMSCESDAADVDAIGRYQVDLCRNSKDTGFIMSGSAAFRAHASGSSISIPVRRLVSRIALKRIKSRLPERYGPLVVRNTYLANVAGNQNLSGTAAEEIWYNRAGRTDNSSDEPLPIDGMEAPASCQELTFADVGKALSTGESFCRETPLLLYCYPNRSITDATGWSIPFTARKTRLIVSAEIAGIHCYYPVTIDFPERNSTYTVELTITGPGSTDPDIPVERGAIETAISIQDWNYGATYDETI